MSGNFGIDTADWIASHIREEHATLDWIMKGMIERAGFRIERSDYKFGMIATYLCTKIG